MNLHLSVRTLYLKGDLSLDLMYSGWHKLLKKPSSQALRTFSIYEDFWGFLWSQRANMRPAIGGEKAVLSPQSLIFNPQSSVLSPQSSVLRPQSSVISPQKCPKTMFLLPKTWFTRMLRESQHTNFEDKIQEQVRLWGFPSPCASLHKTLFFKQNWEIRTRVSCSSQKL